MHPYLLYYNCSKGNAQSTLRIVAVSKPCDSMMCYVKKREKNGEFFTFTIFEIVCMKNNVDEK